LHDFTSFSDDEVRLAGVIRDGFNGNRGSKLSVYTDVDFGVEGPLEVFPSQNYLEDKKKGFARPLYCVGSARPDQDIHSIRELGQAALRDQKIGNAIRTIDTWYPSFAERGLAIPVEPNGASLDAQQFFREKESSGFKLMLRMNELDVDSDEGKFLLACIIRGGVFSGSDK
jgi:CRISPR-associated protein Csy3